MSQPKGYVDPEFLRVIGNHLNDIKQNSYTLMQIELGHKVLDLGCGPGTDTIPLAPLVGANGIVIGADYDAAMIDEAEQRAEQAGVSAWVSHQCINAISLPFAKDYFDSCRSERLFQHLHYPEQALSEMVRVTKPGGWVVVLDTDWGSLSTDTDDTDIERRLTRFTAESFLHNGYSGRKLYRLFKQQNLVDISFEVFPVATPSYTVARHGMQAERIEQAALKAGVITAEELKHWQTGLEQADSDDTYFSSVNIMMLAGRKS
ncbi:methyltransferase domain-containing protein [Methylobacter psychrophilus]|uniref:methyltransferase domain-containing protein n=1 Tax=Methylobacter psychrophilus TaxID=96941 RepID=UPI0021D4B21E|nr:methyltransferase domain-containing protein [Methylobacter psychrophilus]